MTSEVRIIYSCIKNIWFYFLFYFFFLGGGGYLYLHLYKSSSDKELLWQLLYLMLVQHK